MSIQAVRRSTEIAHVVADYLKRPASQTFFAIQSVFEEQLGVRRDFLKWDTWISDREFSSLDLTCHLTDAQRRALNQPLVSALKVYEFILQLQTDVGLIDLAKDLENHALHPRYALIAHLKGGLSVEQVASRCLLYQGIRQFITHRTAFIHYELPGAQPIQIRIEVPASDILLQVSTYRMVKKDQALRYYFRLDAGETRALYHRLKSKPFSERYYYAIPLPQGGIANWSPGYKKIVDVLEFLRPVPVSGSAQFGRTDNYVILIPSYSMFVEVSKIRHRENAIPYIPIMGVCTEATIEFYKLLDLRVLHIGASGADVPDNADGNWNGSYGHTIHDYYHGERDSWLRKSHRMAIRYIVGILFDRNINQNTWRIKWALVNGELYEPNESFGELFNRDRVPWDDIHVRIVLTNMAALPVHWKKMFGITAGQLSRAEKIIYDTIVPTITTRHRRMAECGITKYTHSPSKPRILERRASK